MVRRSLFPTASVLIASAIAFGVPSTAFAQPAAPPPKDISDEADRLFREGNEAFKAEKWPLAIALYESAFEKKKTHDIATNLAYAEMKLGYNARAARYLNFAVKNSPPTGDAERRRIAVERLAGLKAKLAMLTIEVNVAGAQIFLDGKPVGTSPLNEEVFADPGKVKIEAKREGYTPAQQVVQAEKGAALQVKLTLVAAPEEVRGPAVSSITGSPSSAGSSSQSPETSSVVPAGNHNATGDANSSLSGEKTSWSKPKLGIVIAGAATSAVLLGTGVAFTIVANQKGSKADTVLTSLKKATPGVPPCPVGANTPDCDNLFEQRAEQSRATNVAIWTYVAGGAIGAGTVLYAVLGAKSRTSATVQAFPMIGRGNAGLALSGQW